jgi:NADH-quinone oxidoreductase subunit C
VSEAPPPGAAISLRQTLASSKWLGQVCPRCGNELAEGQGVVLCPKCYTPQHAQCWRDNGNTCAVDGTPARIIDRPGRGGASAASPAPGTPDSQQAAPTSPTPRPPTPSADTAAAQTAPGQAAPAAGAPPPPRAVPGAAGARPGGAARPAARAGAGPQVREAPGLRPMADVRERLERVLGDLKPELGTSVDEVTVTIPPQSLPEAARRAKEHPDLRFDYLRCLSGVDYQADGIEVVYHLFSTRLLQKCVLKTRVPGEGEALPSVSGVWAGANWHERETAEMFNVVFEGHPQPEPLLLELDDEGRVVPGPILLKRFKLRPKEPPGVYGFPEEE